MAEAPKSGLSEAERERLKSFSRLSATEKLDWLQQAKEFCRKYLGAARRGAAVSKPPK